MDDQNQIIFYKNRPEKPTSNYFLLLHAIFHTRSLKDLPDFLKKPHEKEYLRDFIESRIQYGVYVFDIGQEWIDVGTPADFEAANNLIWVKDLSISLGKSEKCDN